MAFWVYVLAIPALKILEHLILRPKELKPLDAFSLVHLAPLGCHVYIV
jgi:hypothetical protein